jgi:hypothetical protein
MNSRCKAGDFAVVLSREAETMAEQMNQTREQELLALGEARGFTRGQEEGERRGEERGRLLAYYAGKKDGHGGRRSLECGA